MSTANGSEAQLERARQALVEGGLDLACRLAEEVAGAEPRHAAAQHLLGQTRAGLGHYKAAAEAIERALALEPGRPRWRRDLGAIYFALGDHERAAAALGGSLEAESGDFETHLLHGRALLALGRTTAAVQAFENARRLDGESSAPLLGIARAYILDLRYGDVAELCEAILEQHPGNLDALRFLGEACFLSRRFHEAREIIQHVLDQEPHDPAALATMVLVCWEAGDLPETLRHSKALVATGRATPVLHTFHLYIQLHSRESTPHSIREACETFGRTLSRVWRNSWPASGTEDPRRRLRVGYLTGEFIRGPAFFFLTSLIGNHNRESVEVYCYHTRGHFDTQTAWFQRAGHWHDCKGMSDDAVIRQIRRDEIDVLVDLSAFFPENRLSIFARRAAPIQVTYPNCPTTTGVGNIDYILTDRWTCPPGHEHQYTETPVFLPSGYLMYSPPDLMPEVRRLPALDNGWITFGMFQRPSKTNPAVWDLVAATLRRCPGSRLLVQTGSSSTDNPSSAAHRELRACFRARGIEDERVRLIGKRTQAETLEAMTSVDIALDTFPYQGQTTTCECLWLGVPVVALSGEAHVARVGTALLERVGLGELAAATPEGYVDNAVRLASNPAALSQMREGMRDRLRRSTLLDGGRLASEVESAYRWMWTQWIEKK